MKLQTVPFRETVLFAASRVLSCYCSFVKTKVSTYPALQAQKGTRDVKGTAIPLQAWTDPESSRRMRLSYFKTVDT
jgi:hypothetical protein